MSSPAAPVGRTAELSSLVAALGAPGPAGQGAGLDDDPGGGGSVADVPVVLVVGEGGMGKTHLVRHALARSGALAVVAEGDAAEADLDYGVLDQLVRRSPLDGSAVDDLVPRSGTDPLVAGAALMRFVDGLAIDGRLIVVVDDAQWADRSSLDAMTFAARRLRADQVVLCLACRPEGVDRLPAGLARLAATGLRIDLGPLDARAVGALVAQATGDVPPAAAAERLRAHTEGNPLHVTTLLRELPAGALLDGAPLPAPRSYATLVLGRLAGCAGATRRLVEALSVLDRRPPLTTAMATADLDPASPEGMAALDEVLATGMAALVEQPGERSLVFTHALVGAAVRDDLPASRRQEMHRAAGAAVPGAAGMRHRLAGCAGHDGALAAEAAAQARAEAARGAYAPAARLWVEVARVAPDPAAREHARLQAVDHHLHAGDLAAAARDRAYVERAADGPHRSFLRGRLAYVLGPRREAEEQLDRAWRQATADGRPADADLAGRIAALRATTAVDRADGTAGLAWARRALALAPESAADCNHGHMLAMSCALLGRVREGVDELSGALAPAPASPAAVTDLRLGRGVLRLWAGDLHAAADDLNACVAAWDAVGTFVVRETARFFLADVHARAGRWDDAVVTAETAASIVDETDQVWLAAFSHAVAVPLLAARGEWDRATRHLSAARAAADATQGGAARLWARAAALHLADSRHDVDGVLAAGDALGGVPAGPVPRRDEAIAPWRASYAEALAAAGRTDAAAAVVDWLACDAAGSDHPLVTAHLARASIAVALAGGDVSGAAEGAGHALRPGGPVAAADPFSRGRLELVAGRALREAGDRTAATRVLSAALARFDGLRADPWAALAGREMRAAGGRGGGGGASRSPSRRAAAGGGAAALTAQEQAVVHVVARGATNREAADELFISVKTVEHHLSRAYAKLGLRSRTQLAAVVHGTPEATRADPDSPDHP